MFSKVAPLYWRLKCHVGGDPNGVRGLGCHLTPSVVITALHVLDPADERILVLAGDGIWECQKLAVWAKEDVAVVKKTHKIRPGTQDIRDGVPLTTEKPVLGQTLGYLGELKLENQQGRRRRATYFSQGQVSFYDDHQGALAIGLTGGFVQRGFSGGPVFTTAGALIGVMIRVQQVIADLEMEQLHTLPVFSPIAGVHGEVTACLQP